MRISVPGPSPGEAKDMGFNLVCRQHGDPGRVGSNGHAVDATVHLRGTTPEGSVFLETSGAEGELVEVSKR